MNTNRKSKIQARAQGHRKFYEKGYAKPRKVIKAKTTKDNGSVPMGVKEYLKMTERQIKKLPLARQAEAFRIRRLVKQGKVKDPLTIAATNQVGRAATRKAEKNKNKELRQKAIAEIRERKRAEKEAKAKEREAKKAEREQARAERQAAKKKIRFVFNSLKGKEAVKYDGQSFVYDAPITTASAAVHSVLVEYLALRGFAGAVSIKDEQLLLVNSSRRIANWAGQYLFGYLSGKDLLPKPKRNGNK